MTTARIRISDVSAPSTNDASDADFTIIPVTNSITVIQPNGGEILLANGSYDIKWSYTGSIANVMIELSTDSGATYPTVITASTPNNGLFTWNPINNVQTHTARIRISDVAASTTNDVSDADFTINQGANKGWNPVAGQTRVVLSSPAPYQSGQNPDLAVFSAGTDNSSRGEICNQTGTPTFYKYNDGYTATTGTGWAFPDAAPGPIHKFDVLPDGSKAFVTLAGTSPWNPPTINDPQQSIFGALNNTTGAGTLLFFGDSGNPDPDKVPWSCAVDFSCGVPGGTEDTRAYLLSVRSAVAGNPGTPDGNIAVSYWDTPYNNSVPGWLLPISTQGGGSGLVDDTNPLSMALAADDATNLAFGTEPTTALWILDSIGRIQPVVIGWTDGSVAYVKPPLTSTQYGSRKPVDVSIANAKAFGYAVTNPGFNWLAVLLDNQDGTWSVGVWEYCYTAGPPATFTQIDITDPLPGTPMSIDVDGHDFEIHVLSQYSGNTEATVFRYTP